MPIEGVSRQGWDLHRIARQPLRQELHQGEAAQSFLFDTCPRQHCHKPPNSLHVAAACEAKIPISDAVAPYRAADQTSRRQDNSATISELGFIDFLPILVLGGRVKAWRQIVAHTHIGTGNTPNSTSIHPVHQAMSSLCLACYLLRY
jgi:hypothetical protein